MSAEENLRRLEQLAVVALRLARSAPSGRTALAQLAQAIDPAWIPAPEGRALLAELDAAQSEAMVPLTIDTVKRVLREAWEEPPDRTLDSIDAEPVLVTPVAQVHRAELDGGQVAIKLLRPGLAAAVRQDLSLLETLAGPAGSAFPAADIGALLREVRERVLDDLDFEHQAQALRRLHRGLRDHPRITVPAPITQLSEETVLVREWVDGVPLAEAPAQARDRACADLVIFALGAARAGLAVAELQLAELLVLDDGRLAVADLGGSAVVSRDRVDATAALLEAFAADDADAVGAQLSVLGWLPARRAPDAMAIAHRVLGPFAGAEPVTLDTPAVVALRDRAFDHPGPLLELLVAGRPDPADLWPGRGLAQLFAAIARVGATAPWRELLRAGLRDGWAAAG